MNSESRDSVITTFDSDTGTQVQGMCHNHTNIDGFPVVRLKLAQGIVDLCEWAVNGRGPGRPSEKSAWMSELLTEIQYEADHCLPENGNVLATMQPLQDILNELSRFCFVEQARVGSLAMEETRVMGVVVDGIANDLQHYGQRLQNELSMLRGSNGTP